MSALAFNIILAALCLAGGIALALYAGCSPRKKDLNHPSEWRRYTFE